jgi:SAM-dependent methyltransferase
VSVLRSLRARGVGGALELAWRRLHNPQGLSEEDLRRAVDQARFDRRHGVDTGGFHELSEIDSPNVEFGRRHGMLGPSLFEQIMAKVAIDEGAQTFIDFGCGKGAPLFYAAAYPFRAIRGVEFVRELAEVAHANVARFRVPETGCQDIRVTCADAAIFPIPEGPWLLFFNAPFEPPVCAQVMDNIARAVRPSDPPSWLVLVNGRRFPGVQAFFEARPELERVCREPHFDVFRLVG